MDPFTITTEAASIVSTTLHMVQTCNEYYQKYKAVDLQLVCMQTQCSIIEVALLQIQDLIVHDSARFERLRSVSVLASNYGRTLGACQIVFAILKERLHKLNSHLRDNCGRPDWQLKLKVVWNDQQPTMLLKNIEGQASAISLLLNAIQMKTQVEMLGLLTKRESKSILKTTSDDADTLSLVHEDNASVGLPDSESVVTSKLDDTEFDFDFEIINTAAYRKVFNKARSKLPSKKGSQAVIPPHTPTSSGADSSESTTLRSINTPAAVHTVVASHENNFSSSPPDDSSRDVRPCSVPSKDSSEGACDGSGGMREKQLDIDLGDSSRDVRSCSVPSKDSSEGACDGSGGMRENLQLDIDLGDSSSSPPKRSGSLFGEYTIGEIIGTGQRGEVKLAWKKHHSLPVAIKFFKREPATSNTDPTQRILDEFEKLRGLSHPNIIRLHEVLETGSHLAVVQDYIPGGSLEEYVVMHTRLSNRVSRKVFAQIVSAVVHLHRNGIVHLGLCCSNFLLDCNQNVVLTGFSKMKIFYPADKERELARRGERAFMRGDLMVHPAEKSWCFALRVSELRFREGIQADTFHCGIILFFMLAGCYLTEYRCLEHFKPLAGGLVHQMVEDRSRNLTDLEEVARHPWLSRSRDRTKTLLNPNATELGPLKSGRIATPIADSELRAKALLAEEELTE